MQRRAAAAYVALFVVIAAGAYGVSVAASPPDISIDPDHELSQGDSVTIQGTSYNVSELNTGGQEPTATIEWKEGNETSSASVTEGQTVTLGGTEYVAHFEGDRLQLTSDVEAYRSQARDLEEHRNVMGNLQVVAFLSGLTGFVLLALAYMPVRRD